MTYLVCEVELNEKKKKKKKKKISNGMNGSLPFNRVTHIMKSSNISSYFHNIFDKISIT